MLNQWSLSTAVHSAFSQGDGRAVIAVTDDLPPKTSIITTKSRVVLLHALTDHLPPNKSALSLQVKKYLIHINDNKLFDI